MACICGIGRNETLETLIDQTSLTDVLYALAAICGEKADHLESNWQDKAAAKEWNKAAVRINKATDALAATTHL